MSQIDSIEEAVEKKPQEKHLSDYRVSHFTVSTLDLEFDLYDKNTQVKAISVIHRVNDDNEPLFLFGEQLKLLSVMVDDSEYSDYQLVEGGLLINNLPNEFKLQINTEINPESNKAFEGLYKSGDAFCTQCEAEGFRRITYYLDRPDVMAKFTTKITAEKTLYPSRLWTVPLHPTPCSSSFLCRRSLGYYLHSPARSYQQAASVLPTQPRRMACLPRQRLSSRKSVRPGRG